MRTLAVDKQVVRFNNFKSSTLEAKNTDLPIKEKSIKAEKGKDKANKYILASAALAVISLGASVYAVKKTGSKAASSEQKLNNAIDEIKKAASNEIKNAMENIESKVTEVTRKIESNERKIVDNQKWNDGYMSDLSQKVEDVKKRPTQINSGAVMDRNWSWAFDGMRLRTNTDNGATRKPLNLKVITKLRETPMKYITGAAAVAATLGPNSSVWLPSAETKPEKEGGLGEVPVQMATNYVNEYGIEDSYIPRPLMEIPGKSWVKETNGKWQYWYDGLKNEKGEDIVMDVKKVAEFETEAYHNGKSTREKVEVFYGIDPIGGYKRIMLRNPDYFAADGLYAGSETAEEPERYTFFCKALYDFMKLLKDPNSITYSRTEHPQTLKSIKAPDAIVLNDWHAAPLAALMRALAPVEAANKKLDSKIAEQFENTNLMYIVHNADYQGNEYNHRDDLINTLFGQYALDIFENAKTGYYEKFQDEYGHEQERPIYSLSNPFMVENNVNMANMAMSYANIVKPVSMTYAREMAEQAARSGPLQHASEVRMASGTMVGQSNGWDRGVNEVSQANLAGFNNNLNKDKFMIFKSTVDNIKGLSKSEKDAINQIFTEHKNKINVANFDVLYAQLDRLNIPNLDAALKELKEIGITELRMYKRATCDLPIEELKEARRHNKKLFFEHVKFMIDYNKKTNSEFFNLKEMGLTDLSSIDIERLDEVPFFNMGVRFVDQKGVDIVSGAWVEILSHWDEWYPGRPRPLINIGGADNSADGVFRNMITNAKQKLGEKGNTLVQWDGFVPNNILMAGSDWTMRPSHFEPDGDKWESLYKGTPMVMTRVGGHIDSIKDGFNGFLTRRTVPEIENEVRSRGLEGEAFKKAVLEEKIKDYVEALRKALDTYYSDGKQDEMVKNAIDGNQSWVIKNKEGKIVSCPSLEHLRDLGFKLDEFPQVDASAYERK